MAVDVGTAVAYLDLNMTAFNEGLATAESALAKFKDASSSIGDKLTAVGGIASNIGSNLTRNLTVPLVGLGKSAIDSYRDFESAFTGVRKTVDATEEEYEMLSNAIQKMAGETASSAEDIAGVMEVAGQLGIDLGKNGEEITEFTKIMVELGDSTNLTAEQAATALARFMNITGTATSDVDRLGSTVVDLGNNFAAQEDEITNMALRLASAGTMAGLTETEILGLATAMTSVGIRAEAGGSSMSTTLANIEMAVKKALSGDEGAITQLNTLADVSGMSASEFANAWENDPITALKAFLIGLNGVEEKGGSAVLVLDELGMSGIRQSNMLRALSLAGGELTDAIDLANNAWEENTALTTEAEKRYDTLDSRISQLNERWKAMKRDLAELLIPILEKLMDILEKIIGWWNNLSDAEKEHIVKILEVVAALGPLLTIFGRLTSAIGSVMNIGKLLLPILGGFSPAIIPIVGGIALLVKGFVNAWKNSEEFREKIATLFEKLKSIWEKIKPVVDWLADFLANTLVDAILAVVGVIEEWADAIAGIFDWVGQFIDAVKAGDWGKIGDLIIEGIIEGFKTAWKLFTAPIKALFDFIWNVICDIFGIHSPAEKMKPIGENIILGIIEGFKGLFGSFLEVLQQLAKMIFDFFQDAWNGLSSFVSNVWEKISELFSNLWNGVSGFFKNVWEQVSGFFKNVWDKIVGFFSDTWNKITEFFQNVWGKLVDFFENAWNKIKEFFQNIWDNLKDFFGKIWEIIKNAFETIKNTIVEFFSNIGETLKNLFKGFINLIKELFETVKNVVTDLISIITDLIKGFIGVIKNVIETVGDFIKTIIDTVKNLVKSVIDGVKTIISNFLEKIQNLWDKIVGAVKEGWEKITSDIKEKISSIVSVFTEVIPKVLQAGKDIINAIWEGMKSVWNSVSGWFADKFGWIKDFIDKIKSGISWIGETVGGVFNSHAAGLDYVPYNGYVAKLHQGERVLTKQEAKEYNDGNNKTGGDTFNFYDVTPNPYEYARQIKRVKKELLFDN